MTAPRPPQTARFLEALEARLAPAVIINVGAPTDDAGNTTYNEAPFVDAARSLDPGVKTLFDGASDYYTLALGPGDKVRMWSETNINDYLTVSAGQVLAFFHNKDALDPLDKGRVDKNDLVGLSLGSGAKVAVFGAGVDGDIVSNFNAASGLMSANSLVSGNTIAGLSISGGVNGRVIAAGNISNINVGVGVEQITTSSDGTYTYDFGGSTSSGVGEALLGSYRPADGKAAGNISIVTVGNFDKILGGVGGAGATGGSVAKITVKSDYDGFEISGGLGGSGSRGGSGGAVSSIVVNGFESPSAAVPVTGEILIKGGLGGAATTGAGGAGGAVSQIFVGYTLAETNAFSPLPLPYIVTIDGGDGGAGSSKGGAGGGLTGINVYTSVKGDPLKDDISIAAGDGGAASAANGRGGVGGNVSKVLAVNVNDNSAFRDNIVIKGGNAGAGLGAGVAGGSVKGATVLAEGVAISGGAGSAGGTTGGAGGSVGDVTLSFSPTDRLEILKLVGGQGGQGGLGTGGSGGSIDKISGDFLNFSLPPDGSEDSEVIAGSGGTSLQGVGGRGGSLTSIKLFEPLEDTLGGLVPSTHEKITFKAGDGGNGFKAGGVGGAVTGLTFFGYNTLPIISAGNGGSATGQGPGGAGGALGNIAVQVFNLSAARPGDRTIFVQGGNGGAAAGTTAPGGAGGSISSATVFGSIGSGSVYPVEAHIKALAGQGGAPGLGVAGRGGSITNSVFSTASGDAFIAAGSAGPAGAGTKAAAGGALTNVSASASGAVSLLAGDGRLGGVGGRIDGVSWFGIDPDVKQPDTRFAPSGNVEVRAGNGSVGVGTTARAGAGGSISNLGGYISDTGTTQIYAGDGNGGSAGRKAAAGGSISNVNLFRGLGAADLGAADLGAADLRAGNGGTLSAGSPGAGGAGGSISKVSVSKVRASSGVDILGVEVDILAVAAGNGGNAGTANGKGGNGGNVSALNIFGDIGNRSGSNFGIDGMGGIFAGAGGLTAGAEAKLNGKAGSVTNVTAAAISSIVAGRPTTSAPQSFQLVSLVDRVNLRGLTAPEVDPNGSFSNFDEANLVGGIAGNPSDPGASVFKINDSGAKPITSNPYPWTLGTTQPLDGLVAAVTFTENRNFRPQAWLSPVPVTVSPTGLALVDYRSDF